MEKATELGAMNKYNESRRGAQKNRGKCKTYDNKHLSPTHVLAVLHDGNHFNSNVPDLAMIRGVLR